MIAVDIGNTFTKIVSFADGAICERHSFPTPELESRLNDLARAFGEMKASASVESVWVASVSTTRNNALVDSAAGRCGLVRHFIRPAHDVVMPHRLATPETTGVDRLLSAMAAGACFSAEEREGGYAVAQCGTAATVDFVNGAGEFEGGYILPGPAMWLKGMSIAAQLPDYSSRLPDWEQTGVGDSTESAIRNGMHAALPAAVAEAVAALGAPARTPVPVAVTGGWGETVLPRIRAKCAHAKCVHDPDLLLRGIKLFAERKRG